MRLGQFGSLLDDVEQLFCCVARIWFDSRYRVCIAASVILTKFLQDDGVCFMLMLERFYEIHVVLQVSHDGAIYYFEMVDVQVVPWSA